MWLLDQWAERHIRDAQKKGEFDDLPGRGEPLMLDDDSHIAPELEQRREAVELVDLLKGIRQDDPRHSELSRRLAVLELKLRQAGMNTDFLHGEYGERLLRKINEE